MKQRIINRYILLYDDHYNHEMLKFPEGMMSFADRDPSELCEVGISQRISKKRISLRSLRLCGEYKGISCLIPFNRSSSTQGKEDAKHNLTAFTHGCIVLNRK